jgi:hypothetical protein
MPVKSWMEAREFERTQVGRDELAARIVRLLAEDGNVEAAPGLDLFRYSSPTGPVYAVNEPSFCIIVQGSKELLLGSERYRYDASRYLLVSAGLPVVGRILEGTKERPYLAVRIGLDPALVTAVLMETGQLAPQASRAIKAIAVSRLDANLLDSVLRLVRLVDAPRDAARAAHKPRLPPASRAHEGGERLLAETPGAPMRCKDRVEGLHDTRGRQILAELLGSVRREPNRE